MLKMFTIYDSKSETYLRPFSMRTQGEAIRGFITTLNDGTSDLCLYPADFTLFYIGTFDEQTCAMDILLTPVNLGNGLHMKHQGKEEIPSHIYANLGTENTTV